MDFKETESEIINLEKDLQTKLRIWLPETTPKAILLAIHGALAHSGDWITQAKYFNSKGFALIGFDLRYHGELFQQKKGHAIHVQTYEDYVKDTDTILNKVKSLYSSIPIFILGHSMGALISLYYGLKKSQNSTGIKGMILSSPWLENSVSVNRFLLGMSKFLNLLTPQMSITPESILDNLTHDEEITTRHHEDEKSGLRGSKVTVRFGTSSLKAQKWVLNNIRNWKDYPLFVVIAGEDYIAKPETSMNAIQSIKSNLTTIHFYEKNYHENYNETNREEIFEKIIDWINKLL